VCKRMMGATPNHEKVSGCKRVGTARDYLRDAQEQAPSGRSRDEGVGVRVRLGYGGVAVYKE